MINLSSTAYSFAGGIADDKSFFTHRLCVMELNEIKVQTLPPSYFSDSPPP